MKGTLAVRERVGGEAQVSTTEIPDDLLKAVEDRAGFDMMRAALLGFPPHPK
jgi:hypothetical protein